MPRRSTGVSPRRARSGRRGIRGSRGPDHRSGGRSVRTRAACACRRGRHRGSGPRRSAGACPGRATDPVRRGPHGRRRGRAPGHAPGDPADPGGAGRRPALPTRVPRPRTASCWSPCTTGSDGAGSAAGPGSASPRTRTTGRPLRQLAQGLIKGSERRGARPESMVAYLCQEPGTGESGRDVMERLRPLAQLLRRACGRLDVPVIEALCISDGRFWSYTCPGRGCCPPEGSPMGLPGTSVLAAAATYAGLQVRGSLRELTARLTPWEIRRRAGPGGRPRHRGHDTWSPGFWKSRPRRGRRRDPRAGPADQGPAGGRPRRTRGASGRPAGRRASGGRGGRHADPRASRTARPATAPRSGWRATKPGPALRLWRALARRCVGSYREHAAAPLTLAGWVAWSTGDELEAREALAMALGSDPDYLFARLLHQACNEGLDPESHPPLPARRAGRP